MGPPPEQAVGRVWPEPSGRERDGPSGGASEVARFFADSDNVAGGHDVTVTGRDGPLPATDAQAAAAALEVGEYEEVVRVGMAGFDALQSGSIQACDSDRRDARCRYVPMHRWGPSAF